MIVLDTHALIWWVSDDKQLSLKARRTINKEIKDNGQIFVSAITAWEIAMLVSKGRLVLSMDVDDWLATAASIKNVSFIPVDVSISVQSVRLPGNFHPDPADRMIIALARHYSAPLLTADTKIQKYQHVQTIW